MVKTSDKDDQSHVEGDSDVRRKYFGDCFFALQQV